MTGLKDETEAIVVAELLINILKNIKIHVIKDITKLSEISNIYDFQLVYDPINKNVTYYRKYYNRFLKDYDFNTDLICEQNETSSFVNLNRKNFVKGVHDIYNITSDPIEANNSFIKETDWNGDLYIKYTINKLDKLKAYFTNDLEYKLSNSKSLDVLKIKVKIFFSKFLIFWR